MKTIVISSLMFISTNLLGIFAYDRAVSAAYKGNLDRASDLLSSVDDNRADLLYDKGVIAYRQKKLEDAKQNFLASAEHPDAAQDLIERAYFNTGNVSFALKDLAGARDYYKKVLDINPQNSFAEHNLKKVEEMLKEQKENEKKEEKEENKKDQQKQDQKKDESSQDQKQQDQKNQQQEDKKNKQDKSKQQNQSPKDEQQDQQEKGGDEKNGAPQQPEQDNAGDEQSNVDQRQQQPDKQNAEQKRAGAAHEQKNKNSASSAVKRDKEESEDPATHDEWLATLLEKSDRRDAQGNKKMIKAFVKQQMGGNEGQNCW